MQHSGLLERSGRRLFTFATIAMLLTGVVGFGGESALAQNTKEGPPPVGRIAASGTATLGNGTKVGSFAQRNLANVDNPDAYLATIDMTKGATAIDRPTHPSFSKAKAAQGAKAAKPSLSPAGLATRLEKQPNQYQNFNGTNINSGCPIGCIPPDPDLAVGLNGQVVQTGNSFVAVYNYQGTLIQRVGMNAFFGVPLNSFNDLLFDPRVIFDAANNRWIIIADQFVNSAGNQFLKIATSTTGDATRSLLRADDFRWLQQHQLPRLPATRAGQSGGADHLQLLRPRRGHLQRRAGVLGPEVEALQLRGVRLPDLQWRERRHAGPAERAGQHRELLLPPVG